MRAARVLALITLLVAGLAGTSFAQYSNATGTFAAKIGVVPGALPDAGLSLPAELQNVGPDLYVGEVTVSGGGGSDFSVSYHGERTDGAKLIINATFSSDWAGLKFGGLMVGDSFETGVITGDDIAHLISANINGVGTVDGVNQRVVAKVGAGGTVTSFKILKAPGPLR
jgi:hypothetical protein